MTHILVIDDNPDIRRILAKFLSRDHSVETAPEGNEAIEKARANPPDLILADREILSGMGAIEAVHLLQVELPKLKWILISGYDVPLEEVPGASATIPKPFGMSELLTTIKQVLEG